MSVYSDAVLADTPALYWRLGESAGTNANDETANNRDGTYSAGITLAQTGLLTADAATSVQFTTETANVLSTYNPFTGARTFEGWAYRDNTSTNDVLFNSSGANRVQMFVLSGSTDVTFSPNDGVAGGTLTWTGAWPTATIVHWVLTYTNSGNAELFINGVSKGTITPSSGYGATPGNFLLGRSDTASFTGRQQEAAVYTAILSAASIANHYSVGITGPPRPPATIHVREKPPLRHTVSLTNPVGRHYRWADDEPAAANRPTGLRYSDTIPGGYESADATLPRKPGLDYPDLERLTDWQVLGVGGQKCWGGRLERAPRTSGDEVSVSPSAVGHVALLDDDKSARMIYRDTELSGWQGPTTARRAGLLGSSIGAGDPSTAPDTTDSNPALLLETRGPLNTREIVEAHYDAGGVEIASIYHDSVFFNIGAATWEAIFFNGNTAETFTSIRADFSGTNTVETVTASTPERFVTLRLDSNGIVDATDGKQFSWQLRRLVLYGNHGLTKRGTEPAAGFYASDVVRHAVQTWAPQLKINGDSIQQSSFVIPHLVFLDPTTAGEIVKQASRFDLPDWGVWDDKEFVWHERGARGRNWRARIGPAQLEETGPQVERLWSSIIVSYADVDGSTRTVGPPGSGADTESSDLKDYDPDNPANKLGIERRDLLQMGTSTAAGATEVGRRFLEASKEFDRSGRARFVGWAQDDRGVLHPFSAVRAGDTVTFVDAADTSPRRIVRSEKDHDSRTCTVDLDAPPEALQALLERLGAVIQPLGF